MRLIPSCEDKQRITTEALATEQTVSEAHSKWRKLMKKGGCVKRLWVPQPVWGGREILRFDIWFTLREHMLSVLKGTRRPVSTPFSDRPSDASA